ncbi:MAG: type II toxin-antitoxin system VapC family toxin [Nitrososphaerota archaeon]|nr:type II toxin-antitoxin system VapC family toxin [Nitrososphaerota archaeon]
MPIVDSSVFVKFLSGEEGWEEAERWLTRPSTVPLALKEVANALRTKTLAGEIGAEDAKSMIGKLASLVRLVDQNDLILKSFEISVDHDVTVYDALFVAAAMRSGERELVTFDAKQAKVARELGVRVKGR